MKVELNICTMQELMDSINQEIHLGLDQMYELTTQVQAHFAREISQMIQHTQSAKEPELNFTSFRNTGSQLVATFSVIDKNLPEQNSYNWHGQNTSQWLYAGALVYDVGTNRISSHH